MTAISQDPSIMMEVKDLAKTFTLHAQGGTEIRALRGIDLEVRKGECLVLAGPSGAGKSTLLRCLYGNYLPQAGSILIRHEGEPTEMIGAEPRSILAMRRRTLGFVSQFLRAIPRVPTLELVMEPLLSQTVPKDEAESRSVLILRHLNVPEHLWGLAPATFSGGEQQRVNIARAMIFEYPIMLLDEPTASLDQENREAVLDLIASARDRGAAMIGIFHDQGAREAVATGVFTLSSRKEAA